MGRQGCSLPQSHPQLSFPPGLLHPQSLVLHPQLLSQQLLSQQLLSQQLLLQRLLPHNHWL